MFVNLSSLSLVDAAKFIDPLFAKFNVMQVTFVTPSLFDSSFLVDLFTLVKKRCSLMMIQECSDDYAKCTFVFTCSPYIFHKFLKLKTKLLIQKHGKEVYIYD